MKTTINILYITILLIIVVAIGYSSMFLFETAGDSLRYSFGKTGLEYAKFNFFKSNGRWAQGLSNDYRLYKNRTIVTFIFNLILIISIHLFSTKLFTKNKATILTFLIYTTFLYSVSDFFQATLYFPSILSYIFGIALFLIMITLLPDIKHNIKFLVLLLVLILQNGMVESFSIVNSYMFTALFIIYYLEFKRINIKYLSCVIISIASFFVIYFSPGNIIRREKYGANTKSFEVDKLLSVLIEFFGNHINIVLILFAIGFILLIQDSQNELFLKVQRLKKRSKFILVVFYTTLFLIPICLSPFTLTSKSIFRLTNTSTMYFILGLIGLLSLHKFNLKSSIKYRPYLITVIVSGVILISFLKEDTNINTLFNQVITGNLQEWNQEETARREYLLNSYDGQNKEIPPYSKNYFKKIHLFRNQDVIKERPKKTVFGIFFNNKKSISLNSDLPNIRIINLIEKIKLNEIKQYDEDPNFNYYKNNNVIILKIKNTFDDSTKIKFQKLKDNVKIHEDSYLFKEKQKENQHYYSLNTNYLGFVLNKDFDYIINNIKIYNQSTWQEFFKFHNKEVNPKIKIKEKKEAITAKSVSLKNKLKVTFNIKLKKDDQLSLYYLKKNKIYNAKNSQSKVVKGQETFQNIEFIIDTKTGMPTNLRLDYASKLEQEITIKKIVIQNSDTLIIINQNQVKDYFNSPDQWNVDINTERAIFGVKKNNNRVDPKLLGNNKLRNKLKTFK